MQRFAVILLFAAAVQARQFSFQNNLKESIWIGSQGNDNMESIDDGGWELRALGVTYRDVPEDWSGRFWARTGCKFDADGNGECVTGDCGNGLKCNGAGPNSPATVLEITLGGLKCTDGVSSVIQMTLGSVDYYDVNNINGYNIRASIGALSQPGNGYYCSTASCNFDKVIDTICPSELQVVSNGTVVACKSACAAFDTDQYCCRGEYATPEKCQPSTWPVNYAKIFHDACPNAYSYAYDNQVYAYSCRDTTYYINFGTYPTST